MNMEPGQQAPLAYSIPDFAKVTSLSRSGIYNLIRDGKLKAIKIGGRTIIPCAEANRLITGAA